MNRLMKYCIQQLLNEEEVDDNEDNEHADFPTIFELEHTSELFSLEAQ